MRCCTLPTVVQPFSEMPGATVEEHKIELAAEVLRSGGTIRIRAFGTSMLPTIWPGDILQIESKPWHEFEAGDVVLVKREKNILIHRLVSNDGLQWTTRGDAMPQDDPPVASADVLGRVAQIQRRNCVMEPKRRLMPVQRVLGWMLCHSHVCRGIGLCVHSLWDERGSHEIEEMSLGSSPTT
jgi:signal peptidase I